MSERTGGIACQVRHSGPHPWLPSSGRPSGRGKQHMQRTPETLTAAVLLSADCMCKGHHLFGMIQDNGQCLCHLSCMHHGNKGTGPGVLCLPAGSTRLHAASNPAAAGAYAGQPRAIGCSAGCLLPETSAVAASSLDPVMGAIGGLCCLQVAFMEQCPCWTPCASVRAEQGHS